MKADNDIAESLPLGERHYYRIFIVVSNLSIPIISAFALFHLLVAGPVEFLKILPVPLILLLTRLLINRTTARETLYFIHALVVFLHLLRLLYIGGDSGSNMVWMIAFPLLAYSLLGIRRGSWLMIGAFVALGLALFLPGEWLEGRYDYALSTRARFMIVLLVVNFGGLAYERVRETYRREMEARQAELQTTHANLLQATQEIENLLAMDSLTQCYNRRYLQERFQKELMRMKRYARPLAMVVCDIDHFKQVNDCHGHLAGDQVLVALAQLLKHSIRDDIDFVVRYGGEEFILILPEITAQDAARVAERIRAQLAAQTIHTDKGRVGVTASFGVAGVVFDSQVEPGYDDLFSLADAALYQAKANGRNCVYYADFGAAESLRYAS